MFEAIAANKRKSAFLVVLMALLLGAMGYALGEYFAQDGGVVGLVGAIVLLADVGLRSWFWGGGRSRRSSNREGGGQGQALVMVVAVVLMILAPILARLIYFAVSRKREYLADASAAAFTRYPDGLARALEKIGGAAAGKLRGASRATAPMYIVNPMAAAAKKRDAASMTSTHPPIQERVRILRAMSGASFQDYEESFGEITGRGGVLPKSALEDPHAGAGLRVQGETWRREQAGAVAGAAAMPESAAAVAAAAPEAPESARQRARAVDDWFYDKDGWRRVECGCGAVLKIPPALASSRIKCPRCGTEHAV